MTNEQGQDGVPFLSYYDRTHVLSFVWDGTKDNGNEDRWIDVSWGGAGEPVVLRIPWAIRLPHPGTGNVIPDGLTAFATACRKFIDLLHQIEDAPIGHSIRCTSDNPFDHQGQRCPIHEVEP